MPVSDLPDYIKCRKASFSMFTDRNTNKPHTDDASIFRCLALHHHARRKIGLNISNAVRNAKLKEASKNMKMAGDVKLLQWLQYAGLNAQDFRGVPLEKFGALEQCFSANIKVYRYEPPLLPPTSEDQRTEGEGVATDLDEQLVMEAEDQYSAASCELVYARDKGELPGGTMLVNVYTDSHGANHFSYIVDIRRFRATHVCDKCHHIFSSARNLRLHQKYQTDCDQVQHLFPGNGATLTPTLFERLEQAGIPVEEARRYYPYSAVFDLESCAKSSSVATTLMYDFTTLPRTHSLPEDEPIDDTMASRRYRTHWSQLRTKMDPSFLHCVVRGPLVRNVEQYAYALAQEQTKCFSLRVKVLRSEGRNLVQTLVGTFPLIRSEADFRKAVAALLTAKLDRFRNARAYAVRLEIVQPTKNERTISPLEPVSVAIATNIDGIESSFICRREDDDPIENLVHAFVDRLHEIQAVAAERMHDAYASEAKRLAQIVYGYDYIVEDILRRALESARERLASLTQIAEPGEVSASVDPCVIAAQREHVKALSNIDLDRTDFSKFRMKKNVKAAMHPDLVTDFFVRRHELKIAKKLQHDLDAFCNILPVFGFNSGTFDIKLIRQWLLPYLQGQQPRVGISVLKKGSKYLQISTERLRFLDVSNYLAAYTPYAKWIKAYTKGADTKGTWCYDYFKRPSQLRETSLPPRDAFDSVLKGTRCSEAEYAEIQEIWRANGMRTLYDYLRYYNLRDVEPFVKALETMRSFWQANGHDMFNNVCTLPGLADRFVRTNFLPKHTNLVLPQKIFDKKTHRVLVDNTDLYHDMRRSIVGGPACVYHRLHIAGETRLRGNGALCQHICGWDCNSLYLDCSQKPMPTGIPVRYTPQKDGFFKRTPIYRKMQSQLEWLEWTAHVYGWDIRHQFNSAKAPFVAGQRPDGVCFTSTGQQVLFFFDGCRYHGHGGCIANPKSRFPKDMDPDKKWKRDYAIRQALRERGYIVHHIRECVWMKWKRGNPPASAFLNDVPQTRSDGSAYDPTLREFLMEHTRLPAHGKMTEAGLLGKVKRERFFGTLICDAEVPEHLREHFAEFEPIFKNVEVTEDDLSPLMHSFMKSKRALRKGKLMHPQRMLVNSYFQKDAVLHTPLLRWYQLHGVVIRNVTKAYEFKPKVLYADFARAVANHRRRADVDPDEAIKGDLFKLAGNSIYGKSITLVERHTRTRICDLNKLALLQRNPALIKSIEDLGDAKQWAEVELKQKKVEHNLYTPFGSFVYQYAKLRMLQFYYDFHDYYWERKHFQLMYMETDSFYIALAQPSLAEFMKAVRSDRVEQFNANYPVQFLARDDPDVYTADQIRWDRRAVGLFKVETQAKKMLALNAKSYICVDVEPSGFERVMKLSAKGVIRAQNSLSWDSFWNVLQTTRDHIGISRTLQRPHGRKEVCNITAPKRCLSYAFFKRRLLDDGVSTAPLGL